MNSVLEESSDPVLLYPEDDPSISRVSPAWPAVAADSRTATLHGVSRAANPLEWRSEQICTGNNRPGLAGVPIG